MSVVKIENKTQQTVHMSNLSDGDSKILKMAKKTAEEVNNLNTTLFGIIKPIETVSQNAEEYALISEYREKIYKNKLDKLKKLKNRISKAI